MELNRDDIIKALECLLSTDYYGKEFCERKVCSYSKCENCLDDALRDALSLIKELTEECASLNDENERLRASTIDYRNIPNIVADARADTVKEMKNRIAQKIGTYTKESYVYVHAWFKLIDKIAEEMLCEMGDTKTEVHCTDCKHFVGCERTSHGKCDLYERDKK